MRKIILGLLVTGFVLGGAIQQAQAQEKTLGFNLNLGVLTDDTFEYALVSLGAELDFHLSAYLMISPEVQLWSYKLRFDAFLLNPGVIMNFKAKNFFIGGGVILPFFIAGEGETESGQISPKINVGFRADRIKLTIYLVTSFEAFLEYNLFGASIGFEF